MRYAERKDFPADPPLFLRRDTVTALRIHDEYVRRSSGETSKGIPAPVFFEVDRQSVDIDPLWHTMNAPYDQYSRRLNISAINMFERPDWRLTKLGLTPARRDTFWLSRLSLIDRVTYDDLAKQAGAGLLLPFTGQDYFPTRGDRVFWNGYRYIIIGVDLPPEAYWGQTGIWLGMTVKCVIPPEGDALPLEQLKQLYPVERSASPGAAPATIGREA